jgi:hypothetical protein
MKPPNEDLEDRSLLFSDSSPKPSTHNIEKYIEDHRLGSKKKTACIHDAPSYSPLLE